MNSVAGLRKLPWTERLTIRRAFRGEAMRIGPTQQWLGRNWDLRLAAVEDVIYKVAYEAHCANSADAEELSLQVFTKLRETLGAPAQPRETIFAWDADDGNAVLQIANVFGDCRIMLFLTSRIVRSFTPT